MNRIVLGLLVLCCCVLTSDAARRRILMSAKGSGAAGGPDSLDDIPGLTVWHKADAHTGYTDGNSVSYITNYGNAGTSWDVVQVTAGNKPTFQTAEIDSLPAFQFDGDDWMTNSTATFGTNVCFTNKMTWFIILKPNSADTQTLPLEWSAANNNRASLLLEFDDNTLAFACGNPGAGGQITVAQPGGWDDTWHMVELWRDGNNGEIYVDGTSLLATTFSDALANADFDGAWIVGAFWNQGTPLYLFTGFIAEIACWPRPLTSQERTDVRAILNAKYPSLP